MSRGTTATTVPPVPPAGEPPGYRPFGAFRLLLAALVMVQHFGVVAPHDVGRALAVPATGNIAVLTFFVLSGFIIAESSERFYLHRPVAFFANRALRILPPYLGAVLVSIAAHFVLHRSGILTLWGPLANNPQQDLFTAKSILSNLVYPLPGASALMGEPAYRFIPYAWAVRIEFVFYIVIAAVLATLPWSKNFAKVLAILGVAFIGVYLFWRLGWGLSTMRMIVYFSLGISLYFASKGERLAIVYAGAFYALCMLDYWNYDNVQRAQFFQQNREFHRLPLLEYALLAACLGSIPLLARWRLSERAQKLDTKLGGLSYSLYLNQYVALVIIHSVYKARDFRTVIIAVTLALVLAYLMNVLVEKNTEPLRNAIRGVRVQAI
ncbi:acyltransferase family protein [Caulobacter sp. DWP3-1-3b2]|uniref:acyltransferase family protein n=1 Tax=Caulobacter sp. DWP3-1-3b2 TaxID=2804643 RepID=UPI003CF9F093